VGNGHCGREVSATWRAESIRTNVDVSGDDWDKEDECDPCHDGEADGDVPMSHASEGNLMGV
jgi:hypothetical protein